MGITWDYEALDDLEAILIGKLCKLVYTVISDNIFIIALWDTRRNPESLEQDVKGRIH